jgi:putative membrane protein
MLWVKSLHVIAIISWMAALLYLPRLLVYHADSPAGSEQAATFKIMERRLLKAIATPAMVAAWVFGLWTAWLIDAWDQGWFWAKISCVVALSAYHMLTAAWIRGFAEDRNQRPARFYRMVNEVPALLMVAIVILVIVKPF